nr:nucleotidyl transferase AbiEii/AbiGii toxin family protein [Solirhodobacter olei]
MAVAASASGRPEHLLEKDVWVVWALDVLFGTSIGKHLVFKGGTSLSKAYGAIRRFSEDVDLTYDIRALAPDLVGDLDADETTAIQARQDISRIGFRPPSLTALASAFGQSRARKTSGSRGETSASIGKMPAKLALMRPPPTAQQRTTAASSENRSGSVCAQRPHD